MTARFDFLMLCLYAFPVRGSVHYCKFMSEPADRHAPAQEVRELLPEWALLAATGCRYAVTEGLREIVTWQQQQHQQQEREAAGEDDGDGDSEVPSGVCAALGLQAFSLSHAVATLQVGRRSSARWEIAQGSGIAPGGRGNQCQPGGSKCGLLLPSCAELQPRTSGINVCTTYAQEVMRSGGREPAAAGQAPERVGGTVGAAVGGAGWCWRVLALLEGLMEAREVSLATDICSQRHMKGAVIGTRARGTCFATGARSGACS